MLWSSAMRVTLLMCTTAFPVDQGAQTSVQKLFHLPSPQTNHSFSEPLKGESISLSWPLVEREIRLRRKKSPEELQAVYFDIAFNPVSNPRNLCVQPHGTRSRSHTMPDAYRLLPVSTHCIVTKMYIRCPVRGVLPTTEILVQRRAGVRVIDVFEAIYNEYHRPLDAAEVAQAGDAYLETCRP